MGAKTGVLMGIAVIALIAVVHVLGGLIGAGVAVGYNIVFGVGYPVWDAAVLEMLVELGWWKFR